MADKCLRRSGHRFARRAADRRDPERNPGHERLACHGRRHARRSDASRVEHADDESRRASRVLSRCNQRRNTRAAPEGHGNPQTGRQQQRARQHVATRRHPQAHEERGTVASEELRIMRRLQIAAFIILALGLGAGAVRLHAFVSSGHAWGVSDVSYYINPQNLYVSPESAIAAVQSAASNWNTQSGANVRLVYAGTTNANTLTLDHTNNV